MKKMIKLVAGAVTFGVLSGSVFTGTEYALNRVTGSGITQTQSSKTAATTTKQSDDSTSGITQTSASTSDSKLAGVSDVADYVLPSIVFHRHRISLEEHIRMNNQEAARELL